MTPEQLRASILQYAAEGKLVKQNPNDEPASELIRKIEKEKNKLIKEGKIKKNKKLPAIEKDEKPFDIPDSWEWVRLGSILYNLDGKRVPVSVSERNKKGKVYDYYGASGVIDKIDNYIFSKPLLLISEDGANLLARRTPIAFIATGKYWVNNHAHVFDGINLLFLKYISIFIESIDVSKYVTGTAQPKLNQQNLNKILVAVPPLEEQKRIVAKIEKLMPLVDEYAESYNRLQKIDNEFEDKLKQSVLQYAMEGKLVKQNPSDEPASELIKKIENEKAELIKEGKIKKNKKLPAITDDEKPFDIPNSWEWVRLGKMCVSNIGLTYKPAQKSEMPTAVKILRANNIQSNQLNNNDLVFLNVENIANKYYLKENDILMAVRSGSKRLVGKSAVVNSDFEGYSFGAFMSKIRVLDVDSNFINYFFNSNVFRDQLGDANTTTINQITQKMINNFVVPVPPIEEQKRIVGKTKRLLDSINILTK
ncbi:restriction endonuclease subunit S [Lactobacillus amylovorus subsp. amylovorus]|uniref:restriction endonuclease subunit S n=1 Tax=Lactobacillus amylovorus TaxID=1604 RepID=UPI0028430506|nr:restriction endonuclease subunit S [Lactobacillus amylovorus]